MTNTPRRTVSGYTALAGVVLVFLSANVIKTPSINEFVKVSAVVSLVIGVVFLVGGAWVAVTGVNPFFSKSRGST